MMGGVYPTVLLHAFPLSSTMYARVAIPDLIAPDLAGFGTSAVPDAAPSLDVLAGDVVAGLDARGVTGEFVLGGVSMGGYVAMAILRLYPQRVKGLILADTKASADTAEAAATRLAMADSVLAGGDDTAALPAKMLAPESAVLTAVQAAVRQADPAAVAWAQRAMAQRPDSFATLRAAVIPALVLVGEHDTITPLADARAMAEALPDAQLTIIPGAGHLPPWENPVAFTTEVTGFLAARLPA